MEKYKRLTGQPWSKDIDLKEEYGYSHIYKRLYELENQSTKSSEIIRRIKVTIIGLCVPPITAP